MKKATQSRCISSTLILSLMFTFMLSLSLRAYTAIQPVPVTEEPLHIVKHSGKNFLIYTNWIEPGVSTLYHRHRNDLLAVIAADAEVTSQKWQSNSRQQTATAGTLVFFPYADEASPYVHRIAAIGNGPFINVGLEFLDSTSMSCANPGPKWDETLAQPLEANRRGQGYQLILPAAAEVSLPTQGRGLLLVPLASAQLQIDQVEWNPAKGDFRFYDAGRPARLKNIGSSAVTLVIFDAC
jgi:hypothetical protein